MESGLLEERREHNREADRQGEEERPGPGADEPRRIEFAQRGLCPVGCPAIRSQEKSLREVPQVVRAYGRPLCQMVCCGSESP